MKNKLVSLLNLVNLIDDEKLSENYIRYIAGLSSEKQYRHQEISDLNILVNFFDCNLIDLTGFIYSYEVPHLNKEFDLLKITENECVNIELKSEHVGQSKIRKQLIENGYYLNALNLKKVYLFTFVSSTKELYQLCDDFLKVSNFSVLTNLLKKGPGRYLNLDDFYSPERFLISPLNDVKKFINNNYLLTEHQRVIKNEILNCIAAINNQNPIILGLTGCAGTGKTLLLYDIAKEINESTLIIHCGQLCYGHRELEKRLVGKRIISVKELNCHLDERFDVIMVDESQRLKDYQYNKLISWAKLEKVILLFSFDDKQTLSRKEEKLKISKKIEKNSYKVFKLTKSIRINKELTSFICCLFDLSKAKDFKDYSFNKVKIIYEPDISKAVQLAERLDCEKKYTYISYTPSFYDNRIEFQASSINTHKVIGQEFNNVCMILGNNFFYDGKKLRSHEHPNPDYLYTKILYQGLTMARERICLIITEKELLEDILSLFT